MITFKVERATEWKQVEGAALVDKKCIRPKGITEAAGTNWNSAKETWDTIDSVCYFIVKNATYPYDVRGYVRLFNTTPKSVNNPTWALDFMCPMFAEIVVLVADLLPGNVLVKGFFNTEPLSRNWPKVVLSLNIPQVPYRLQTEKLSEWLVVT